MGSLTVSKLRQRDLSVVSSFAPDIVILEIGTNDLTVDRPEVVGSTIEELVRFLKEDMAIRVVGVCEVIPRGESYPRAANFNESVSVLNQHLRVVLPALSNIFAGNIEVFTALLDLLTNLMGFMSIPLVSISCIGVTGAPC